MKETQDQPSSGQEQEIARELTWLEENLSIFWLTARFDYEHQGRRAVVINATEIPLGEDTQFHYANQAIIEEDEDKASHRLARFVAEYDLERQFVLAIIRPVR